MGNRTGTEKQSEGQPCRDDITDDDDDDGEKLHLKCVAATATAAQTASENSVANETAKPTTTAAILLSSHAASQQHKLWCHCVRLMKMKSQSQTNQPGSLRFPAVLQSATDWLFIYKSTRVCCVSSVSANKWCCAYLCVHIYSMYVCMLVSGARGVCPFRWGCLWRLGALDWILGWRLKFYINNSSNSCNSKQQSKYNNNNKMIKPNKHLIVVRSEMANWSAGVLESCVAVREWRKRWTTEWLAAQ